MLDLVQTAVVACLTLSGPDAGSIEYVGPGRYELVLDEGSKRLAVEIVKPDGDGFLCKLRRRSFTIGRDRIKSLRPLAAEKIVLAPEVEARCLDAVGDLASVEPAVLRQATRVLADALPGCRGILHEALRHRTASIRAMAAKILGEHGNGDKDAEAVARLLRDPQERVRRAAIFALRAFGPGTMDALLDHLRREPAANLRKAIVKTCERWKDLRAVAPLVSYMQIERSESVRRFIGSALRSFLGRDYGSDAVKWKVYYDSVSGELEQRRATLRRELGVSSKEES